MTRAEQLINEKISNGSLDESPEKLKKLLKDASGAAGALAKSSKDPSDKKALGDMAKEMFSWSRKIDDLV